MIPEKFPLLADKPTKEEKSITLVDCHTIFQHVLSGGVEAIVWDQKGSHEQLLNSLYRVITDPSLVENIYSFIAQIIPISDPIVRETLLLKTALILVQKGYVEEGKKIMLLIPEGAPGQKKVMSCINEYNQCIRQTI